MFHWVFSLWNPLWWASLSFFLWLRHDSFHEWLESGMQHGVLQLSYSCVCESVFVAKPWNQGANTANTGWSSLCWTWSFIRKSWSRHTTTPVHPTSVSWTNQPTTNEPLTHEALWILDKKVENVWLSDTFGADDVHFLHHQPHLILSVELLYNDLVCILVYLC